MLNLDPAKLLVIAVVAIILLGPDKLPQVARQVGGAWRSFNEFRHRMETEVRNTMPDLPSTTEIARLARSPSALLDHLSNMGPDATADEADASEADPSASADDAPSDGETTPAGDQAPAASQNGTPVTNGSVVGSALDTGALAEPPPLEQPSALDSPAVVPTEPVHAPNPTSPDIVVPGDPSLN